MSPRHSNTDTGWIKRELAAIKKQLRESGAAKRAQAMTVGKGGITVRDGGTLAAHYPASMGGTRGVWFGPLPRHESDAAAALGLQVSDEDGAYIFQVLRQYPSDTYPDGQKALAATVDQVVFVGGSTTFFRDDFAAYIDVGPGGASVSGGAQGVYITHSTTGASANCFLDPSDNRVWREVSAAKYKQDIEDAEIDPSAVLQMQPITYRDKGEVERNAATEQRYVGLLAEDLVELGLTEFVTKNDAGEPEGIAYPRLTVALLAVLKDQEARLAALEAAAPNAEH